MQYITLSVLVEQRHLSACDAFHGMQVLQGGAIRVFDRSHKGSNLALMVELLAGPLVGAAVQDKLEVRQQEAEFVAAHKPCVVSCSPS